MRRFIPWCAAASMLAAATMPALATTATVKVRDSYFTPDFRVVVTGDTVVWNVEGSAGHTITAFPDSPVAFDSSPDTIDTCESSGGLLGEPETQPDCLDQGDRWQETFDVTGTIDYYCKIHGTTVARPDPSINAGSQPCGMCGRIVVKTPSTAKPATRSPVASTPDPEPTDEPSESPSASATSTSIDPLDPSLDPSLVATPSGDDGSASLRVLFALSAIALLVGVGLLVWRRYFQPE